MSDRQIPISWQRVPLYGEVFRATAPEGSSIQEIVDRLPNLPLGFQEYGFVCVNAEPVPRELWPYVRPKVRNRDVIVTVHTRLQGSTTFRLIATIAVILIAAIAGPFGAGLLGFTAGTAGFFAASAAISGAIAIGGSLLLNALAPPPVNPQSLQSPDTTGADIKAASLSGNTADAGGSVPRVLGMRKVFPVFISRPMVELIGLTEVVEGVFGLMGPHQITDIRIGGVPVGQMEEVQIEVTDGFANSPQQTLVKRQARVATPSLELSNHLVNPTTQYVLLDQGNPASDLPSWHRLITRNVPDEFWLSLSWPEGFFRTDGSVIAIPLRFRMRPLGTSTWINLPEVHFYSNKSNVLQSTVKFIWGPPPSTYPVPPPLATTGPTLAYTAVPAQTSAPSGIGGWTAHGHFGGADYLNATNYLSSSVVNTALYSDRVEFFLDQATFPQGIWEVELIRGYYYLNSQHTASTYANSGVAGNVLDYFQAFFDGTFVRILNDRSTVKDKVVVVRATSIWNENPVPLGAPFAVIALKATGRSIQDLSCVAAGYIVVPGVGYGTSNNPAAHYYDVLTGPLGSFPLDPAQVDTTGLTDWFNHCVTKNYTINTVIQGMKQMDVLQLIAAAGYARPVQSETWGVAQDKNRTADVPVQMFTPRNMSDFQWTKTFTPFTDGFRVKYDDSTIDYVEDEIVVIDPEGVTTGIRLEDIRYETIVTQADAVARATFDLRQARRRLVFYTGTTDLENIACRRGDLVSLAHDTLDKDMGFARISQVLTSGGNITGLVLDGSIPAPTLDFFILAPEGGSHTVLLLHGEGPDASTIFTDSSPSGHVFTPQGNAQIDTAQFKFGSASMLFDGAGDFLSGDGDDDFAFGTADFTIDFWLRPNVLPGTFVDLYSNLDALGNTFSIRLLSTGVMHYMVNNSTVINSGALVAAAGSQLHGALARVSGTTRLFMGGILAGTYADSNNYQTSAGYPRIGDPAYNGWLDEVRVVKGIGIWKAAFTPPTVPYSSGLEFFNDPTLTFFHKPTRMGITIRTTTDTMLVKEITGNAEDATTVTFVTPFANTGIVQPDCLIASGVLTRETKRLLVHSIAPKDDTTATITFVDEAPDLFP